MAGVSDCHRVQAGWYAALSHATGRSSWTDAGQCWAEVPGELMLLFPSVIDEAALARGLRRAEELAVPTVGAWLDPVVDTLPLEAAGFERGWEPWWMASDVATVLAGSREDPGVVLQQVSTDYDGDQAAYAELLAVTRQAPQLAWYAAAYSPQGRFAGRAWAFLDGSTAGVFDVEVWPRFRRQGIGTALCRKVIRAARNAGAEEVVLNSTPAGEPLYLALGFERIGTGITWWRHRPDLEH